MKFAFRESALEPKFSIKDGTLQKFGTDLSCERAWAEAARVLKKLRGGGASDVQDARSGARRCEISGQRSIGVGDSARDAVGRFGDNWCSTRRVGAICIGWLSVSNVGGGGGKSSDGHQLHTWMTVPFTRKFYTG